jgi:hypothetical protein
VTCCDVFKKALLIMVDSKCIDVRIQDIELLLAVAQRRPVTV